MKFFNREETKAVLIILSFILLISVPNYITSLRKARDTQRKNDLGALLGALDRYASDFREFPLSRDGKILACGDFENPVPCEWGKDSLRDTSDPDYPPYMELLPQDPHYKNGAYYVYLSNGNRFQIYGALEGSREDEYDEDIIARNISCGVKTCNFGRSYGVGLDISIEEYENELLQSAKEKE